MSSIATLTVREELVYRVLPLDQSFTENYAGIFHFQFWRYGEWIDIVIDDLLPTHVYEGSRELIYLHSTTKNEFWTALLEKAFAKLYGCYENLVWGSMTEALGDCTGGLTEILTNGETDGKKLLTILKRGLEMGSLFGCLFPPPSNGIFGKAGSNGLVGAHAYSVTSLLKVKTKSGDEQVLLRLRNPWGHTEWKGDWADEDYHWNEAEVLEEVISCHATYKKDGASHSTYKIDGEFCMPFEEFLRLYWRVEVCNLSAEVRIDGSWSLEENTAGGGPQYPTSYYLNPQFGARFTVTSDCIEHDGKCNIIVAVLQKELRIQDNVEAKGSDFPKIGLSIYRAPTNSSGAQDEYFFSKNKPVATTPECLARRELTVRLRTEPGDYILVPCTKSPDFEAEFMVRIFVDGEVDAKRLPFNH
ncbi:hypothetical protein PRIPAC_96311 [Pristionchus pacificus]|uniref:Peptidase n=1 Tax=Pristionchus pacificus TaxID=54126 RepID=A0A2A6BD25_PRIPA|nr:hypothetical protein PRIPAC_96311 [Pristionchus pacificus]|eukprot:PDM63800.1 Peptidase [Pristionchus pacificus]